MNSSLTDLPRTTYICLEIEPKLEDVTTIEEQLWCIAMSPLIGLMFYTSM